MGKFLILADLVAKGEYALAFIAMLMAAVAVVFYLRLIIVVWSSPKEPSEVAPALPRVTSCGLCADCRHGCQYRPIVCPCDHWWARLDKG